jgi:hypothetical protein
MISLVEQMEKLVNMALTSGTMQVLPVPEQADAPAATAAQILGVGVDNVEEPALPQSILGGHQPPSQDRQVRPAGQPEAPHPQPVCVPADVVVQE